MYYCVTSHDLIFNQICYLIYFREFLIKMLYKKDIGHIKSMTLSSTKFVISFTSKSFWIKLSLPRDTYNILGIPDKMSGQININLTLSSHRYF